MLNDVAALPRLRTDIQIYNSGRDQNAMKHVFRWEGREDDIVYQPRGWYNGFHNDAHNKTEVVEGDLLVHFAGTYKNRTGAMKEWMSKLQRESEKLAVPFEKTILKQDIEDFWADLKDAKTRLGELALELPKHNTTMTRSAYDELRKVVRYDPANSNRLDGAMRAARKAVEDIREKTTVREAKGKRPGVGAVR